MHSYSVPTSAVEFGKAYESVTVGPTISSVTVGPSYASYSAAPSIGYAQSLGVAYAEKSPAALHAAILPSGK